MTFVLNFIYFLFCFVLAFSFLHEQKHNLHFKSASVYLSADFLIKYSHEKWASAMQIFSRPVLFKTPKSVADIVVRSLFLFVFNNKHKSLNMKAHWKD